VPSRPRARYRPVTAPARPPRLRGGPQRIPRPPDSRPGPPAPWVHLPPHERRLTVADVRRRLREMPEPRRAVARHEGTQPAAVLLPIFEEHGQARVILTRRPDSMPTHQGEVAFPGGRFDPVRDATLRDTALREATEEIGLAPSAVDIAGELDGLATVGSRFTITPFVGILARRPELHHDVFEVVHVFDVALADLMHPDAYRSENWGRRAGFEEELVVSFFEVPGETIWGATARILTDFLGHLVAST
jgi:8-oxo-dGTP pyrophosphatase MutT (NUDIX family)